MKKNALAFALVPVIAINAYAGCRMLNKMFKNIQEENYISIEKIIDEDIIQGGKHLGIDLSAVSNDITDESQILENDDENLTIKTMPAIVESTVGSDFTMLDKLYKESKLNFETILNSEERYTDLYASALYAKLKSNFISDEIIKSELYNIIVYGSNATSISIEEWNILFGNLSKTISKCDNVVDFYYPLAKYIHLQECELDHDNLYFDSFRICCEIIQEQYDTWNARADVKAYFTEMVMATDDDILIQKYNKLLNSNIDFDALLCELEHVYNLSMIPIGLSEEEWFMYFGNLEKTVEPFENVCIYYYDLAYYLHSLCCELEHNLNEFDRYTCDARSLTLEM